VWLVLLLAGTVASAQDIVSQLGNPGPAYAPGMKPSALGWGPDDTAYSDKYIINPNDLAEMVWVPAGRFRMGILPEERDRLWEQNGWDPNWKYTLNDAQPAHEVTLTRGFWLYRHTVTNGQYMRFLAEAVAIGGPLPDLDQGYPKVPARVTWIDADLYARWAGGQIATEAQREWAARGPENRLWPWGNEWDSPQCNSGNYWAGKPLNDLAIHKAWIDNFPHADQNPFFGEVGTQPGNVSWCGAWDLCGKCWEWCQDWFAYGYYAQSPATDPGGPATGEGRTIRGAGWASLSHNCLAPYRSAAKPDTTGKGFRLMIAPEAAP
jgi:formylglycine-generating enzyme required for sulfatase activity